MEELLGALFFGLVVAAPMVGYHLAALPYAAFVIAVGAGIGVAGLLSRSFGAWLARRP